MAIFALILLLLGITVLFVGMVWFTVNAFRVSVLWGICVCLFTPAWIRFAWRHWDMAGQPFLITLVGLALACGGSQLMPADAPPELAEMAEPFHTGKTAKATKKRP